MMDAESAWFEAATMMPIGAPRARIPQPKTLPVLHTAQTPSRGSILFGTAFMLTMALSLVKSLGCKEHFLPRRM